MPTDAYPITVRPGDLVWLADDRPPLRVLAPPRVVSTIWALANVCVLIELSVRTTDTAVQRTIRVAAEDRLPVERRGSDGVDDGGPPAPRDGLERRAGAVAGRPGPTAAAREVRVLDLV
ncbi:MAG TPA: hypothetical protein VI318_12900 [Baekduia sp.]